MLELGFVILGLGFLSGTSIIIIIGCLMLLASKDEM